MIRYSLLIAGLISPFVISGCVAVDGASNQSASVQRGQVVKITPSVRAEIERQGHDPDEEVCKRMTDTGSTIPSRVCATRGAWEAKRQASREGLEDGQRRGLQTAVEGG